MKTITSKSKFCVKTLAFLFAFTIILMPFAKVNAASQTPITRSQAEQRALSMINYKWTYTNTKNSNIASKYASMVTQPSQLSGAATKEFTGIPYNWGGMDSQYSTSMNVAWTSFADAINKGAYAGNVNFETGYGYVPGTAGIDCSGFVQATFNIKDYKISTSTMFDTYFKKIALSDLKHMDILDKPGDHVVIFDKWGTLNGVEGAFTYESTPYQTRGGIQGTKKYFISMEDIKSGYIPGRYVNIVEDTATTTPTPTTVSKGMFAKVTGVVTAASLRNAPADASAEIGIVPKGTIVYLIDSRAGWFQVNYKGQVGWIWGNFASAIPSGKYVTVNGTSLLNIRTSPSTTASIISTIGNGQYAEVKAYSSDGSWYQISINGITGWAYGKYLNYIY